MKTIKQVAICGLFISSLFAHAGQEGGGGNALVCFSDPAVVKRIRLSRVNGGGYIKNEDIPYITSVEMLDLRKIQQPKLVNGSRVVKQLLSAELGESETEFEERVRSRFKDVIPEVDNMLSYGKNMIPEFRSVQNGIAPIDDVTQFEVYNSDLCVRSTIIAQYDVKNDVQGIFDQRIYDLDYSIFNIENRVASRWHEYFYAIERMLGAMNSEATQRIVGLLFQKDVTFGEVVKSFEQSGISNEVFHYWKKYGSLEVYTELKSGLLSKFIQGFHSELVLHNLFEFSDLKVIKTFWGGYSREEKDCSSKFRALERNYEKDKTEASKILNSMLLNLKEILPLNSDDFYVRLENLYLENLEKAKLEKEFYHNERTSYCRIKYNFRPKSFPSELDEDLYSLKL